MKKRPILFSGPMVRALLAGTKTQTRRIVKPQDCIHGPTASGALFWIPEEMHGEVEPNCPTVLAASQCPYGLPGDRLWVKETHSAHGSFGADGRIAYRADLGDDAKEPHGLHWKPSIFMTRKSSRITLEVTGVRVERLNDISEADAIADGFHNPPGANREYPDRARYWYRNLWESINGAGSWDANPFVWVIEFRRVTR